jgi:hypothetical protein
MRALVRRVFASWNDFLEYLTFLSVCLTGVFNASWLWIIIGAMVLLLLSWSRYAMLFKRAGEIDREWRDLASLMRAYKVGHGLDLYAKAWKLPFVLAVKLGHDALFLTGAFIFGHVTRWVWW